MARQTPQRPDGQMAPGETFASVSRSYTYKVAGICVGLWLLQFALSGPVRGIAIALAVIVSFYLVYLIVAARFADRLDEFLRSDFDLDEDEPRDGA